MNGVKILSDELKIFDIKVAQLCRSCNWLVGKMLRDLNKATMSELGRSVVK